MLSGTGIVEKNQSLEIIDVRCNLKQFDLTDPEPQILRQIYATDTACNFRHERSEVKVAGYGRG